MSIEWEYKCNVSCDYPGCCETEYDVYYEDSDGPELGANDLNGWADLRFEVDATWWWTGGPHEPVMKLRDFDACPVHAQADYDQWRGAIKMDRERWLAS